MGRIVILLALFALGSGPALAAGDVPLPRARPAAPILPPEPPDFATIAAALGLNPAETTSEPTACDRRLEQMAKFELMPRLIGPGACGGRDLVRIEAVLLPDKSRVAIQPRALLTCPMVESLAAWVRDEVAPLLAKQGARLRAIENYDAYSCRTRNRVPGAKLSQHAHGDAIDVRAFQLTDGRRLEPTDPKVDKPLRIAWRDAACRRFTTVLGPGDAYHSGHIHLDGIARRNGYRICQWDVRDPVPVVPLPRPRPAASAAPTGREGPAGAEAPAGKGPTF